MFQMLPPGEMQDLVCDNCKGKTFHLRQEVQNGEVLAFHTVCDSCGKRGGLVSTVEMIEHREFVQFEDPPEGCGKFRMELVKQK